MLDRLAHNFGVDRPDQLTDAQRKVIMLSGVACAFVSLPLWLLSGAISGAVNGAALQQPACELSAVLLQMASYTLTWFSLVPL